MAAHHFSLHHREYLLKAKTVKDLVVHSEARQLLWRSLRERAVSGGQYRADLPEVGVDPQGLLVTEEF